MCRLFAMSGGGEPVSAAVWLLDAPDSLSRQSHENPDGTGLGIFDSEGRAVVHKAPISAFSDDEFAEEARHERAHTFLAHVRFASATPHTLANTHPFEQEGRIFAHNGVLTDLPRLERELGPEMALVGGETDSERVFTLITREIRRRDGDVRAGVVAATGWIARNVPMYSLNLVLTAGTEVFALRYPDNNTLYVLERPAGGSEDSEPLRQTSDLGTKVLSDEAAERAVVVIASEPMDEDPAWRALEPGELLRVDAELGVHSEIALPEPPVELMKLHQLSDEERASQVAPAG